MEEPRTGNPHPPPPPSGMPPPPRKEVSESWANRNPDEVSQESGRKTLLPDAPVPVNVQRVNQDAEMFYRGQDPRIGMPRMNEQYDMAPRRKTLVANPPVRFDNYDYQTVAPRSLSMESYGIKSGYDPQAVRSPLETEVQDVLIELHQEMAVVDGIEHAPLLKNSKRLLKTEAYKLENNIDPDWVEVDNEKPIKITKKILVPYYRYPHLNWVGRILGAKGGTVRNIMDKFKCTLVILGAHSTRDRQKEIELLNSGDPQYAHFASPMHIQVTTVGPAHLAYIRIGNVMKIFNKLLQLNAPDIEGITVSFFTETGKRELEKIEKKPNKRAAPSYVNYDEDEDQAPEYEPLDEDEDAEGSGFPEHEEEYDEPPPKIAKNGASSRGGGSVPKRGPFPSRGASRGTSQSYRGGFQPTRGAAPTRGTSNNRGGPNRGRGGGFVPKRGVNANPHQE